MKKGLKEFQEVYDIACAIGWLALDLAQNLYFKKEMAKPEYAKISEEDLQMAYGIAGGSRKYQYNLMDKIHKLANALSFTKEDYIKNADKRQGKKQCNIYVVGKGSINCDLKDLLNKGKPK